MKKSVLFFCVASLLGVTGIADALPFQNGSFEVPGVVGSGVTTLFTGNTSITGWTVASGSIDYVGSFWEAAQGTSSIDMNGLPGFAAGVLSQTFDTVAGTMYEVIFAMAGYPDSIDPVKSLEVSAPGFDQVYTFDTTNMSQTNMGWTNIPFTFTATGALSTLTFTSLETSAFGPAVDNVRINLANGGGAPVPEPATLLLLGAGLTGLGFFSRKKFIN